MKTTSLETRRERFALKVSFTTILAILIAFAVIFLTSCGVPLAFRVDYADPDTGLIIGGGYSSKGGIEISASK